MPAASAELMGLTNEVAATTVVAMPGEPAVTASLKADSMVGTVGWVDRAPVQCGVGRPRMAAASAKPYWVGVKNELSVTWLTKVNFHLGVVGKLPASSFAADAVEPGDALLGLDELHAAIRAEAAAVALNRPAPSRSRRRDGPSFIFRVWIASSTCGSIFFTRTSMEFSRTGLHRPAGGDYVQLSCQKLPVPTYTPQSPKRHKQAHVRDVNANK